MMASTLQKVLDAAFKERDKLRDQYVSIEHLVLALATTDTRFLKPALVKQGVTEQQLREAVGAIRGNNLVTTRTPEAAYEVGWVCNARSVFFFLGGGAVFFGEGGNGMGWDGMDRLSR